MARTNEVLSQGEEEKNGDDGEQKNGVVMKRTFGLHHGVAVICGLVIGSGVYISPKGVLLGAESTGVALILWAMAGLLAILGSLCYAELGTTFPRAGEKYVYLEEMFGPFIAFLFLWTYLFLGRAGANAIKCLTFASYFLKLIYTDCDPPNSAIVLFAFSLGCFLTFINCISVKWSARYQTLCVALNVTMLVIIACTGLQYIFQESSKNLVTAFDTMPDSPADIIVGFYAAIFATSGWTAMNFLVEELKNPYRNLPLAMVIAVSLSTVLFVMVNLAYVAVLGPEGILSSDAVAVTYGQRAFGPLAVAIPIVLTLNMAVSLNSGTLVASRLCFAGSRRGHLPKMLALVNTSYYSPMAALIFMGALSCIYCTFGGLFGLIRNTVFAMALCNMLAMSGMVYLRIKRPDIPRPIKIPLIIPIVFSLVMLILVVIPLISKPAEVGMGMLIILCTGVPYYLIVVAWQGKPASWQKLYSRIHIAVQKISNSA